ncbi:leukocyte elastase inhibitor-like [Centruroides sculpturatus]|uniref:leukocyte elastase inhibitor-like n=1 Tax=Centruroides sculpturatus TaxID=218467 RepID=UPI000C6C9B53|nr:leukocyte elastase inhibitor-like [Centruroides sculpturatus]
MLALFIGAFTVTRGYEIFDRASLKKIALANNEFSFELLRSLESDKNIFMSPFSIYVALAMLSEGAKSETYEQIRRVLNYNMAGIQRDNISRSFKQLLQFLQSNGSEYELNVANAMILQSNYSISNEFLKKIKNDFNSLVTRVSFETGDNRAVTEINNWIRQATGGKIKELFRALEPETRLVLLNAIYFKSVWENAFDSKKTYNRSFYNNGVNPVQVPFMHANIKSVMNVNFENFRAISLPYKGKDIQMIIVLPTNDYNLKNLQLNADKLEEIISEMKPQPYLELALPKFTLEESLSLNEHLKNLGMTNSFTRKADLSGITGDKDLYVSEVMHKAVIDVNEEGSVAAGTTGLILVAKVVTDRRFYCDRPFLFVIRDMRTGMNLFVGQLKQL